MEYTFVTQVARHKTTSLIPKRVCDNMYFDQARSFYNNNLQVVTRHCNIHISREYEAMKW